ncbi:MAG: mechanosensitive ion channel family protein [Candidatus Thermoplasmatota archaeon]|nr:mechanosensitive ion channel family protein [Candidatus Thermoplasmatota archaeon]GIR76988.1 MAG: mechanosensitive ion channel protein [Candidatus Poseidoniales archaeon]MEC7600953.1 mechanosensitive ion channel family protein [Candidatus Thermoplasmatota archaeon]MEC7626016.1 mechanosensitive ion channel family protein [Candidatus Thermoplasmatota archaeon]MEC8151255.1 mechanosensitive ion channel family protein [Candidatus Thermoplasmatota archaeon]
MDGLWNPAADSALRNEVFGFTTFTLLAVVGLLVMIFIVRLLTMRFAPTVLGTIIRSEAIKGKTVQESDKALGTAAGVGLAYLLVGIMIDDMDRIGSPVMMPELAASFLPGILQFIVAIAVVVWAFRLVNIVHDVVMLFDTDDQLDGTEKTLISALQSVLRFAIIFVGAVFVADSMGFDLTSLIAGLGISGLALALAAKDSISNFFGAITVLLDRPFKVGDWIIVGAAEGEVIEINLRTTLIRTSADTIITMPNANLVNTPVENVGKRRWRRWQTQLHLDINADGGAVDTFCQRVLKAIEDHPKTLKEEASFCQVSMISATSLDVDLNLYWDVSGGVEERQERAKLIIQIKNIAEDLGIEFYDGRVRQQR